MKRKLKENFEERKRKEKKEQMYKYKENMFDDYRKKYAPIMIKEIDKEEKREKLKKRRVWREIN